MNTLHTSPIRFRLDSELSAREPVEATPGATRSDVRVMASIGHNDPTHHMFAELPSLLDPGDLLVVNDSTAMAAAVDAIDARGRPVRIHISTELPASVWLVEARRLREDGTTSPDPTDRSGERLDVVGGMAIDLLRRLDGSQRLWIAHLDWDRSITLAKFLAAHGRPIRYDYVKRDWPLDAYRTVFGRRPGSAEMPSASRPFTESTVVDLVAAGVGLAPLTLHTGVSSLEAHETPYPERFEVPAATARLVNHTRRAGGRVVAIGTTVVRALESVVDDRGDVHPGAGWTDVIVTPQRGAASVDGLLTGWHEPEASHLQMLAAIAAPGALQAAYDKAVEARYRWHEFGDVHLITR
ncbi:MAG: S-adenosylmethionine:tRNA ribosyltransferase-isomerase [Actinomycetota bacterium]